MKRNYCKGMKSNNEQMKLFLVWTSNATTTLYTIFTVLIKMGYLRQDGGGGGRGKAVLFFQIFKSPLSILKKSKPAGRWEQGVL